MTDDSSKLDLRVNTLRHFGAAGDEIGEIIAYNKLVFNHESIPGRLPLEDEAFVGPWMEYHSQINGGNCFDVLRRYLVQLNFPIESGISKTEHYRDVTLRGVKSEGSSGGLLLKHPEELRLIIHPTVAGHIPVLMPYGREDFTSIVRSLAQRNEPAAIPESMGALTVSGYNNWDRINRMRADYERDNSFIPWAVVFDDMMSKVTMYQDKFIILSDGPYSNCSAAEMGIGVNEWKDKSLIIRREHECAHYLTKRLFLSMKNNIMDELIADFSGITAAFNEFRAGWFLRFIGLENFPEYRKGGRLENYKGDPALSDGAFIVLQRLIHSAAHNLEAFYVQKNNSRLLTIITLTYLTLEEIASPSYYETMETVFSSLQEVLSNVRKEC
ncbi:DUF7005 family protein [Candidatus Magnetominusculus xianensis]|uniref:Uncharacterized protein n=1 Tax=Candidatus Magnetominusculus xianensis TaxID=1748249 RepID=A0ABR5SDG3_9BACT|nr:hypothetical protein [Candidatus Magnetominusculus xianensis]KWT78332.1 hypothetical protein ASN18_2837 [Candidatus Magnetominusculus xianensis]MBF0402870.1 hypothetical protein [Nitrospirota bacterium]